LQQRVETNQWTNTGGRFIFCGTPGSHYLHEYGKINRTVSSSACTLNGEVA
jgi:hypothetical protein